MRPGGRGFIEGVFQTGRRVFRGHARKVGARPTASQARGFVLPAAAAGAKGSPGARPVSG